MATLRQAPMISVPMKTTDEVELIFPLKQFIRLNYGHAETYSEECNAIHRLRQDMRGAGKDAIGRDLLYRYYGQLELLELRFPIDEDHIRISFNWQDAFTQRPTSQFSLAYEKACVLFNISAVLSSIALAQTRSEADGMKKAYHSFQAAAGLLNFINDNFLHAPSTDLSREMVKSLSSMMLAQAQEVFTEKQISDQKKASIIAKLCAETANLYHNANEGLMELAISGNVDKTWAQFSQVKEKYYTSLAHFYQASAEEFTDKYGEAIARLALAETLVKDAIKQATSHSSDFAKYPYLSNEPSSALLELLRSHSDLTKEKKDTLKKENDLIYHVLVPKESALSAVGKLPSAKAIQLQDLYAGQDIQRIIGHDIFHKLVPLSIHESASMYSEEIAKIIRSEQDRCDLAEGELVAALDYLGLPKSLHQFKLSDQKLSQDLAELPSSLSNVAAAVAEAEAAQRIEDQFAKIRSLKEKVDLTIAQVTRMLDEEGRQCESMRAQRFETWNQAPSASLTGSMRNELRSYKSSLDAASKSDASLFAEYEKTRADIQILRDQASSGSLGSLFFEIISQANSNTQSSMTVTSLLDLEDETCENEGPDIAVFVNQVDEALRKLNLVKRERQQTLKDFKELARDDDISDVLLLNKKVPGIEQKVFATELEKFKPYQQRITGALVRQEQLLDEMTIAYKNVLEDKRSDARRKKWDTVTRQRNKLIDRFERVGASYEDVKAGLGKALRFYHDLEKLTDSVLSNAKQFISNRQIEGRQMLEASERQKPRRDADDIHTRLARLNLDQRASPQPALRYNGYKPPPPPPGSYNNGPSW